MAYHIYHTEGIVLGGNDTGEDSRMVRVYTNDLGMVFARAQGARKLASKHRYHLQDFSYGRFSFIRGKEVWRVIGSEQSSRMFRYIENSEKLRALAKVASLLTRLAPEEDPRQKEKVFFPEFFENVNFLFDEILIKEEIKSFETFFAIKTLHAHGYWRTAGNDDFHERKISKETLSLVSKNRRKLNTLIHKALEYSQL